MLFLFHSLISRIATLWLITVCLFFVFDAAPGDPMLKLSQHARISANRLTQIRDVHGLGKTSVTRYLDWLGGLLQADFGKSIFTTEPVSEMIAARLGNTLLLMIPAFTLAILISILIGTVIALRRSAVLSISLSAISYVFQAIPIVWFGTVLVYWGYTQLWNPFTGGPLFPAGGTMSLGHEASLPNRIGHIVLPLICLVVPWAAIYIKYVAVAVDDALFQPHVLVAKGKGLPTTTIILRHVLRNALPYVVTLVALDLSLLFAGAFYVEYVFSWPGMGRLFQEAAARQDYPVLLGVSIVSATIVVAGNFLADIAQYYLDRRVSVNG